MRNAALFDKPQLVHSPGDEGLDDDFFDDGRGYHIKDNAPQKAKDSYYEFYDLIEHFFGE